MKLPVLVSILLGLLVTVRPAASQEPVGRSVQGYAFFAPGVRPSDGVGTYSAGGGVGWLPGNKLAIGVDGHFFGWWECSSCGALVLTGNAGFLRRRQIAADKWEPFALVGIGVAAVDEGGIGIAAFSGGTNYWIGERLGLRFEGRYEYVFEEEGLHSPARGRGVLRTGAIRFGSAYAEEVGAMTLTNESSTVVKRDQTAEIGAAGGRRLAWQHEFAVPLPAIVAIEVGGAGVHARDVI